MIQRVESPAVVIGPLLVRFNDNSKLKGKFKPTFDFNTRVSVLKQRRGKFRNISCDKIRVSETYYLTRSSVKNQHALLRNKDSIGQSGMHYCAISIHVDKTACIIAQ